VHLTEMPYMDEKKHEAMAFIRAYPADEANFVLHRFVRTWLEITESPFDLWRTIPVYVKVSIVVSTTFSLLAFLGAWFAVRSKNEVAKLLAVVLMAYPLVFYVTHTGLRYRFPIDSLMLVFAVYAVAHCVSFVKGRAKTLVGNTLTPTADQPMP